jgi:hypothetical protein
VHAFLRKGTRPTRISDRFLALLGIIGSVIAIIGSILTAGTVIIGLKSDVKRLDDKFQGLKTNVSRNDDNVHSLGSRFDTLQNQVGTNQSGCKLR